MSCRNNKTSVRSNYHRPVINTDSEKHAHIILPSLSIIGKTGPYFFAGLCLCNCFTLFIVLYCKKSDEMHLLGTIFPYTVRRAALFPVGVIIAAAVEPVIVSGKPSGLACHHAPAIRTSRQPGKKRQTAVPLGTMPCLHFFPARRPMSDDSPARDMCSGVLSSHFPGDLRHDGLCRDFPF